jgi:hypothetical protein
MERKLLHNYLNFIANYLNKIEATDIIDFCAEQGLDNDDVEELVSLTFEVQKNSIVLSED